MTDPSAQLDVDLTQDTAIFITFGLLELSKAKRKKSLPKKDLENMDPDPGPSSVIIDLSANKVVRQAPATLFRMRGELMDRCFRRTTHTTREGILEWRLGAFETGSCDAAPISLTRVFAFRVSGSSPQCRCDARGHFVATGLT